MLHVYESKMWKEKKPARVDMNRSLASLEVPTHRTDRHANSSLAMLR